MSLPGRDGAYLPLPAPLDLLDHVAQMTEQLAQHSGRVVDSLLIQWLFESLGKWLGNEDYVASKIQRGPLGIVPLS